MSVKSYPYSINNWAPGHKPKVGRYQYGRNEETGRPLYGTHLRCQCGWTARSVATPSLGGKGVVNNGYKRHLETLHLSEGFVFTPDDLSVLADICSYFKLGMDGMRTLPEEQEEYDREMAVCNMVIDLNERTQ